MASSLNIQEVLLTNTFDEFRLRTNTVIEELNKFGTGSATVIVGSLETSTGLGEDGHLTVNGDLLVTGNATIEGNLTFGNAETDTISFVADIASNVLPDTPYNFSLGSATKQWQDLYLSGTANINIVSATSATVTNDFTVDTTTFHVDSTANRVGILTAAPDVTLDIGDATDAIHIPVGTTAERPGAASAGYFRYNTSLNQFEGYSNNVWGAIGGGGTNTFTTDIFTGDNVTTDFVLAQATEFDTNLMVFIDGVYQTPNAYDVSTTLGISTLSFSAPPATGRTIVAYVVAAGVSGNNLNQNSFTGDGVTVTYALTIPPINKNNTQVFIDGVYQQKDAYSVSGYDLTFTDPPPDQTTIEVMTFTQTEVNVPVDGTIESVHLLGDLVTPGALDVTTDLTVTGTTTLNGNLVIGDANTDTITISSQFSSSLIPSQDVTYDLGASGNAWRDLYLAGSTIYIGGGKLEYNDTLNQFELKNSSDAVVPVSLSANSTSDLSEGTNLYYTTARVLSDGTSIVPGGSLGGTVGDVTLQYRADGNYSGTPAQGSFYFDALNSRLKVYTGSSFIDAVPVSGGGGGATTNANATFSKYLYTIPSETNVVTGASDEVVGYTQLYIGKNFEIVTEGTTDFIAFGATTGTVGETFTVDSDGTSVIADLVLGKEYKIVTAGDTDFTAIGAADNNPDTVFTFNGVTTQSATTGTVIAEGNGTANPVLVYVVDDATSVEVYVNGIKQYEGATNDYVATTGSSVNFTYNLPVSALVDVQVYELLTNDAYYTKAETYSQAQVNTQISNALTIYDDQTASDARYVNIDGDTMTGNLDVTGTVSADGLTVLSADTVLSASIGTNEQRVYITPDGTEINYNASGNSAGSHMFQTGNVNRLNIAANGDISFYEDTGTTAKFFWDASAESLGIGTSSPSSKLVVAGTGIGQAIEAKVDTEFDGDATTKHTKLTVSSSNTADSIAALEFQARNVSNVWRNGSLALDDGALTFLIPSASNTVPQTTDERMRISSTGNVTINSSGTIPTGVLLGRQLVVGSATGSEIIAFREDTDVNVGDISGALLIGNSDIDGVEDHFVGMWGKVSSTNGSQDLHFAAGRSGYESDVPQMTLDSSGKVGINKIDPETILQIGNPNNRLIGEEHQIVHSTFDLFTNWQSDTAGKGAMITFSDYYNDGAFQRTTRAGIKGVTRYAGNDASGALVFYTNENASDSLFPRMTIDELGKVGIRSNTGAYADTWLHVDGDATVGTIGTTEVLRVGRPTTNAVSFDQYAAFKIGRHTAPGGGFESHTRLDIDLRDNTSTANSDTNVMTLLNNGNVGIGTPSPEALLSLSKTTAGGEGGYIYIDNPATSTLDSKSGIKFGTSAGASFASTPTGEITNVVTDAGSGASALTFGTFNGTASGERMRIDASGNLLLGKNSTAIGTEGTNLSGTSIVISAGSGNTYHVYDTVGANYPFVVSYQGAVTCLSVTETSDERLKKNITDLPVGLEEIKQLRPVQFDWKDEDLDNGVFGFIAQEVEQTLPSLVTEEIYKEDGETRKAIKKNEITAILVKAIQEQQEQIEQLKAEVAALKGAN